MPELPEIETVKNYLNKVFLNKEIISAKITNRRLRKLIPDSFEKEITNAEIVKIYRKAKYFILELDNGKSIIWHLGMSGTVENKSKKNYQKLKHDHVVLEVDGGELLVYNDARRFGMVDICESAEINQHSCFRDNGIEPFEKGFDEKYLKEKLKSKRINIKTALLDPKVVVGIGNIYASEALYYAGISPFRESNSLTKVERNKLIESIVMVLDRAIKAGGSSIRDYKKPDGEVGYFSLSHAVYGKEGQKCPNCNCDFEKTEGIKKSFLGGRSSFYCVSKQK